jgi:hypothetical protein
MKTVNIELLAEHLKGKLWEKGDVKRLYVDKGFNTKKMRTKAYVFPKIDGTYGVNCTIDCPSQDPNWIVSQESKITDSLIEDINEIIEEFGHEIEIAQSIQTEPLEVEEQVQGYYMRWHDVRLPISKYGKLATRKRQKVHTYKGAITKTPSGFVALSDDLFGQAQRFELNNVLYEYGQLPNFTHNGELG